MNMFKSTEAKSPEEYILMIDEPRRAAINTLYKFIRETVPTLPVYMQSGMIAFGSYHYKYASGKEGNWMIIGLSSRKNYISVYVCATDGEKYLAESYKDKLPKADIGKSCIRFKKVEDIDLDVLGEVIKKGAAMMTQ